MKSLINYGVVIFDLDNTLYCEDDYLSVLPKLTQNNLQEYLEIRRTAKVKINLYPMMKKMLIDLLLMGKNIAVLTNGNVQQQKNKVAQLDWPEGKILFVYASEIEPKPSPRGLHYIMNKLGTDAVFIGDSETDKQAAESAKIDFIWSQQLFQ